MKIDVATFIGPYPFRSIDDTTVDGLLRVMDRVGVAEAWVGYLASFLHHDPANTNEILYRQVKDIPRLRCVPTIDPGLPSWEGDIQRARDEGAVAIRVYPMHQDVQPDGPVMCDVVAEAGISGLPVVLTVRFEDVRQRHPMDTAGDFPAAAVRRLARVGTPTHLIVTHASRAYVEEVHFGLTPDEAARVHYDISWFWGPPADDLDVLITTIGAERFVYGSGYPLRIPDAPGAKLDLAALSAAQRKRIESENVQDVVNACRAQRTG